MGKVAETDHTAHPTGGQFMMSWPSHRHCFRRDLTDVWKKEKDMASLTEDETEVSTQTLW